MFVQHLIHRCIRDVLQWQMKPHVSKRANTVLQTKLYCFVTSFYVAGVHLVQYLNLTLFYWFLTDSWHVMCFSYRFCTCLCNESLRMAIRTRKLMTWKNSNMASLAWVTRTCVRSSQRLRPCVITMRRYRWASDVKVPLLLLGRIVYLCPSRVLKVMC